MQEYQSLLPQLKLLFIHILYIPQKKNIHNSPANAYLKKKKPLRFQGVVVEWRAENTVCVSGKPPLPRRSMAAAGPFKDGETHFLYGGLGFLPHLQGSTDPFEAGDNLNSQSKITISGISGGTMKQDYVTFGDTFLIHDLRLLPKNKLCGFGIKPGVCNAKVHPAPIPNITENIYNGEGNGNSPTQTLDHIKSDKKSWYPWRKKEPTPAADKTKSDWYGQHVENLPVK